MTMKVFQIVVSPNRSIRLRNETPSKQRLKKEYFFENTKNPASILTNTKFHSLDN